MTETTARRWAYAAAPAVVTRLSGTPKGSMIMRTAYRVLAYLLALSVAVQASLIAFGAFALEDSIDNGPVSDGDTTGVTLHHSFAYVVALFAIALLAVSFGAKVEHGVRWAAIPLGLIVAQFFLAYAAYSAPVVGVLHGLNALAIFAVALLAGRRVPKTAARGGAIGRGGCPGLNLRVGPRSSASRLWGGFQFHAER